MPGMPPPHRAPLAPDTRSSLRHRAYVVIFEADTPGGRLFDVALLVAILGSVLAVMIESVPSIEEHHRSLLLTVEWIFTGLFTIEFLARIYCVSRPSRYVFSFFGIVDLLALLPAYLSLVLPNAQAIAVVRILRILRVFRILKLTRFLGEANVLRTALTASAPKIIVFIGTVLSVVVVVGALMHLIEGDHAGFESIPAAMYWAIVTLTTVGFGDVAPVTPSGKFLASVLMIMGYGIIAVPTGIVTAEMVGRHDKPSDDTRSCRHCLNVDHRLDAVFCRLCGEKLGE